MIRSSLLALCLTVAFLCPVVAQQKTPEKKAQEKNTQQKKSGGTADASDAKGAGSSKSASDGTSSTEAAKSDDGTPAKPDDGGEQASDDANSDDPAVAEFDKVFAEWKELLSKLQDLRAKYILTPRKGNLRQPIKKEFDELVKQGDQLEPKVITAAEAAFAVVGNKRPEIGKFLAAQLKHEVENDNYEPAVPIAKALIDNTYENARVYNYGGVAALATGDFDDAEKWLTEGDEQSGLDVQGKQALAYLEQSRDKWEQEAEIREKEKKADDLPRVLLKTSQGDITLELFENEAPNTVANFISLVEQKYYDGLTFHRVLPHFMAQGGDPSGDGSGGPGYNIPDEVHKDDYRKHFRGSLSMAKTQAPNSGGSQFFLCFVGTDHLDGVHTVFGRVIDGMDVLGRIRRTEAAPDKKDQFTAPSPKQLDRIEEAVVLRKRQHEYVPKKVGDESASESDEGQKGDAQKKGVENEKGKTDKGAE